jgi:ribonucleoside-triphosphate reductase
MQIKQIRKRDGRIVSFTQDRITQAVYKAFQSAGQDDLRIAERVSDRVTAKLEQMFGEATTPTVEQTQDLVEKTLMEMEHFDVAKSYIIYREKHQEKREMDVSKRAIVDFARRLFKGYVGGADWRSKENSNSGQITFQGANARFAGDLWNIFALDELYPMQNPEISRAHRSGQIHIHDLDFPVVAYCCGHSLDQLLRRGFGQVKERVQSSPAKHLRSAVNQIVNAVGTFQGEFAGAQAYSSVDSGLAPFIKIDGLNFKETLQSMQELIYGLNVPSRWGWQAPFSNLTFDLTVPKDLRDKKAIVGGKEQNFTYGDCQEEMNMLNLAYLTIKKGGDKSGRIFTFPIDTYNITKDFQWSGDVSDLLFEVTGKYGIPYFQNYIGSGLDPGDIRAMCCRLNLDQRELMKRPGCLWGPGDSTGSVGVVTINMNRIGYEAKNEEEFFKLLGHRMDLARQSLELKRTIINELLGQNFVPYTRSYLGHFTNHFSTIGLVGMDEGLQNFLHKGIVTPEGKQFAVKALNFMRDRIRGYQEETGNLYNLEATPAEGASYRLAKLDKEIYPNIHTSGNGAPYLTNSTQLPVDLDIDLFSALRHQEELQTLYTGGTIFHTFLGERIGGHEAKTLVRKIAENTRIPYFSITPVFSVCEEHGYIPGIVEKCAECGEETEVYDRVVGYIRPVKTFNPGKEEEFKQRRRFDIA